MNSKEYLEKEGKKYEDEFPIKLHALSLSNLFEYKKWLDGVSTSGTIVHNRKVIDIRNDVDKEIWYRMIDTESPWKNARRFSKKKEEK